MTRIVASRVLIEGAAGPIETLIEVPEQPRGIALVCHPHPLFGGTLENKIAQTLAKTLRSLGHVVLRPNFRGVGASAGTHDEGEGETEDMLALVDYARGRWGESPLVLAGYSFGAWVQTRVAKRLAEHGKPARRLVLVGTAAGFVSGARSYPAEAVPPDTIVIHGEKDTTVPLANVLDWARGIGLPVTVVPDADHFFHRRLHVIRAIIENAWHH
ncbi:MAG: alpha/beta hydrolase [Betaproteobacteria bacterium CG2_30_68_42]|nr:MAG: alpha/beta hydrolase [Betaproteobacteria bacterium CG2_30_68_42]PIX74822.1 MAG: alpha/beta hydrolase [Rhodocyclales bacterium CG_4_10_14_3_um_filter_68_10]PJA58827.1 MAG: alpha/beta hydrolase [Rhodocyclales bacterium CG_4_9_14_3_um_filter_68_10]